MNTANPSMSTNLPSPKFLTPDVLALFDELCHDAPNWSGTPLFGHNVGGSKESKGHLTALKKAGLVTTWQDEDDRTCHWVSFTDAGRALALTRVLPEGGPTAYGDPDAPDIRETVDGQYMVLRDGFQVGGRVGPDGAGDLTFPDRESAKRWAEGSAS